MAMFFCGAKKIPGYSNQLKEFLAKDRGTTLACSSISRSFLCRKAARLAASIRWISAASRSAFFPRGVGARHVGPWAP